MNDYGGQQYGPQPWGWPPAPTTWPHGPDRPGAATTAAVLGFVTGGLTGLASLLFLLLVATKDETDAATVLLVLGLPCAVGLIAGAARLVGRRSPGPLFGSAATAVAVLLIALVAGAVTLPVGDVVGLAVFIVLALPLPVLTAVFTAHRTVRGWVDAGPG